MENYLANKIGTMRSVSTTADLFHDVWENTPIMVTYFGDLDAALDVIDTNESFIEGINSGIRTDKEQKEHDMVMATLKVSAAGYAYAVDKNDEALTGKMDITKSDFSSKVDEAEPALAGEVYDAINPIIASLTGYPVVAADLLDLKNKIDAFKAVLRAPRDTRAGGKEAKIEIKRQVDIGFGVFDKVDKLMINFDNASGLAFYNKYFDSRMIINMGKGHRTSMLTFAMGATEAVTLWGGKIEAGDSILIRNHSKWELVAGLTNKEKGAPVSDPVKMPKNTDLVLLVPPDANMDLCPMLTIAMQNNTAKAKVTVFLIKGKSHSKAGQVELTGSIK